MDLQVTMQHCEVSANNGSKQKYKRAENEWITVSQPGTRHLIVRLISRQMETLQQITDYSLLILSHLDWFVKTAQLNPRLTRFDADGGASNWNKWKLGEIIWKLETEKGGKHVPGILLLEWKNLHVLIYWQRGWKSLILSQDAVVNVIT